MTKDLLLKEPLHEVQIYLKQIKAKERLIWAMERFGSEFAATTSFGIQSAVLLHMLTEENANVSIIWVDTGYLPKETYIYAHQLEKKLNLNLKIVQSTISPPRMEALYGQLWNTGNVKDLELYHQIRKIEPLENILKELQVKCWASGVRSNQTSHRSSMTCLDIIRGRLTLRPILEWTNKDIFYYMEENNLPQHPLFEKGYSTVGDWHSSASDGANIQGRETRFGGLKEECGIHLPGVFGEGI